VFRDKLQSISNSLTTALEVNEQIEAIEDIVEEDCDLYCAVSDILFQLNMLVDNIHNSKDITEDKEEMDKGKTPNVDFIMGMYMEIQEQVHQSIVTQQQQIQQQHETMTLLTRKDTHTETPVKLPKLDLPSFSGDRLKWAEFWDCFDFTVHTNSNLSDVEKFSYLASKVDGDTKRAILGLSLTNDNYKIAIQFLKERFGEPQHVIDSHYTELMKHSQATNRMFYVILMPWLRNI